MFGFWVSGLIRVLVEVVAGVVVGVVAVLVEVFAGVVVGVVAALVAKGRTLDGPMLVVWWGRTCVTWHLVGGMVAEEGVRSLLRHAKNTAAGQGINSNT